MAYCSYLSPNLWGGGGKGGKKQGKGVYGVLSLRRRGKGEKRAAAISSVFSGRRLAQACEKKKGGKGRGKIKGHFFSLEKKKG